MFAIISSYWYLYLLCCHRILQTNFHLYRVFKIQEVFFYKQYRILDFFIYRLIHILFHHSIYYFFLSVLFTNIKIKQVFSTLKILQLIIVFTIKNILFYCQICIHIPRYTHCQDIVFSRRFIILIWLKLL